MAMTSAFDAGITQAMDSRLTPTSTPVAAPSSEQPPSSGTPSSLSPSGSQTPDRAKQAEQGGGGEVKTEEQTGADTS
eukprot:4518904-Karenia_brevis.AAC.1